MNTTTSSLGVGQAQADRHGPVQATRAPGVRSLGAYEGSGFREDHYLAARPDGQVVHLSRLLHLLLTELEPRRSAADVAARVSAHLDRELTTDGVNYLLEHKLAGTGLITLVRSGDEAGDNIRPDVPPRRTTPMVARANPLLALRLHGTLLPAAASNRIANALLTLFEPWVVGPALIALIAVDVALIAGDAGPASMTTVLREPTLLLVVLVLLLGGTLFHEFGHATACRYGGGHPGAIGVGVYVLFPAFYTNVTDAYRLSRRARLRTDLGGVYFNAIAALGLGGAYLVTGYPPLLIAAFLMHLEALQQFLPLVRSDGYFILADLVGVPDLFGRIRPVMGSLLPWRKAGPRVQELCRSARLVITGWVLVVVPVLGAALVLLVLRTPSWLVTSVQSVGQQWTTATTAAANGAWAVVGLAMFSMLLLVLPMAGLTLFFAQLTTRVGRAGLAKVTTLARTRPTPHHPVDA